jgi:MFS family permease
MALFAVASALVSLAAIPVVLSVARVPEHEETETRLDLRRLFRISPAGALGSLSAGLSNGSFWALAAVFVGGYSQSVAHVAWFMTATVIGGAIGQWPLGLWSDRVDRRWVLAFAALAAAVISAVIFLLFDELHVLQLMLLGGCWGAVAFPVYAVSVAHSNDYARPGEYVMISSGMLLMYGVGAVIGPLLASLVMSAAGAGALYLFAAIVHALFLLYVVVRLSRRAPVPDEEHFPFSESLAATQTASHYYEEEL